MKLLVNAFTKFILGFMIVALLLFLPAGTINYIDGWVLLGLLFVPILIVGVILYVKSPELLKKRLDSREEEGTQKGVVAFSGLIFLCGFLMAGLDFRFAWTKVHFVIKIIATIVFIFGYLIYAEVLRENAYLSRTIKVEDNQKVIDTGLYALVRHPMYLATILLFLMIPLILGSYISFICFVFYPVIIIIRISNEEKVLSKELTGYNDYKQRVKYRLIPFIY